MNSKPGEKSYMNLDSFTKFIDDLGLTSSIDVGELGRHLNLSMAI